MRRRKVILAIIITIVLIPTSVIALALQNPPWARSPIIRGAQSFIAQRILSMRDVTTITNDQDLSRLPQLAFPKVLALQKGDIEIISTLDAPRINGGGSPFRFTIAVIEPLDLVGKSREEQRRIVETVDDLAVRKRIDAIVEATASDTLRTGSWGTNGAQRLHDAGVIRCVIFDGGHHIGSLKLAPDILLVPVTCNKGEQFASHWFTRDIVSIQKLQSVLQENEMGSIIVQFPRSGIPIKNRDGMAGIAIQAIKKAIEGNPAYDIAEKHRSSPHQSIEQHYHAPRSDAVYISLNVDSATEEVDIVEKVRTKIERSERAGQKIKRAYIGLTFGESRFPYRSTEANMTGRGVELFLSERFSREVHVVSEPYSTWDIYLSRFGIYPAKLW